MIDNAMLVTSCPDCKTTFRVSTEILEQANGQVRCGICSKVFDGYSKLRQIADPGTPSGREQPPATASRPHAEPGAQTLPAPATAAASETPRAESDEPTWLGKVLPARRRVWPWALGAGLLALTLAGQFVYQFRAELAALPGIGPTVTAAYSNVGIEVTPAANLSHYDLLDLTAAAQPLGEEPGWLIIETRVINEGPGAQPYPHIFVRLLDRWDATVAGRYFRPEEYIVSEVDDFSRMNAGVPVDAQFVIMDPGPNATGFELEICVPAKPGYLCESDIADE